MILTKDMLTKSLKKGRTGAISLLQEFAKAGGLPEPTFEYIPGGTVKRPSHFFKVRFRVPQKIIENEKDDIYYDIDTIFGAGRCKNKSYAKSLAALDAVHQLEEALDVERNGLKGLLDGYLYRQQVKQDEIDNFPITQQLPNISWSNVPFDTSFSETLPATRRGYIDFTSNLINSSDAFLAARVITLTSRDNLPKVEYHANQRDYVSLQRWANIKVTRSKIKGIAGVEKGLADKYIGIDNETALIYALERIGETIQTRMSNDKNLFMLVCHLEVNQSFGMAKLFVQLPIRHHDELKTLLFENIEPFDVTESLQSNNKKSQLLSSHHSTKSNSTTNTEYNTSEEELTKRINAFRTHQSNLQLPIDSVQDQIPYDAEVTIVKGGTGSGKTTRYPLMISLFSPQQDNDTVIKILVCQPRRLACQSAARRVAYEQNTKIGKRNCPVGYSIRFESFPSSTSAKRTIDFQTPGVILRYATYDPLLSTVTHICIDEIHERNADIDLLLALAKHAQKQRRNHPTLQPLQIIIMSATIDTSQWETYFGEEDGIITPAIVNVPDIRRFPINIVHLKEPEFPKIPSLYKLKKLRKFDDCDEIICEATAELAMYLFNKQQQEQSLEVDGGSILCFLPGMEEIQQVKTMIRSQSSRTTKVLPTIRILHSSVSSKEQGKVFEPGLKIILSTNIAETSLTIPDVKYVIDSGRERQFSLLDSVSESATVVGSQLVTVDISKASAKQRAGRAGRVSAGTCYRLYTKEYYESQLPVFTEPEMLRMDLSQLVLHSISLFHPTSGFLHPLSLLQEAPDPPTTNALKQTIRTLENQGLVCIDDTSSRSGLNDITLTPLGRSVSAIPASPRIGKMLILGLVLRAAQPALTIAALLSVPKALRSVSRNSKYEKQVEGKEYSSDIIKLAEEYENFVANDEKNKNFDHRRQIFGQVTRVRRQLEHSLFRECISFGPDFNADEWNTNASRIAAHAALICCVNPHIAHLVNWKGNFATRDVAAYANIHPSSVNFLHERRSHWYIYHELLKTKAPYLNITTAVSPLELALFSEADSFHEEDVESILSWLPCLFMVDQWIPVHVLKKSQNETFLKLRRTLNFDMQQVVASNPASFLSRDDYQQVVLYTLSAMEQQRMKK